MKHQILASNHIGFAYRRCGEGGLWQGRKIGEESSLGWTNYTPCFPSEVQILFVKVYEHDNDDQAKLKFEIAQRTRHMEIVGFSISLVALTISLIIFSHYRSLRNNRTRIHKSLFMAMVVQVLIRLTVYIDQELVRSVEGDESNYENATLRGIDNMPYVCESSYVMLEYAISVMFMWMFIEGLYLHNLVTANALRERISHLFYYATGWGLPLIVTAVWATMTALHYSEETIKSCWYGYNFSPLYWIVQAPRLAVIMINMVFLLNIMRVLIVKLRKSQSSEVEKVRKAVRAALVLLPLLGITNILNMIEAPLDGTVWEFGLWSYSTHFLRSFQGFFIALIYCFLNGEVRQVLRKHYENYKAMHMGNCRHRESFFHFLSSSDKSSRAHRDESKAPIAMKYLKWFKGPATPIIPQITVTTVDDGPEAKIKIPEIPDTVTEQPKNNTADQKIQTLESYENSIVIESTATAEFHDEQPSTSYR
ncbi:PDF receptor-like [Hyposmocoma kahamanoa]|uniref:PDF receptor-like n=1 Tax=Hyposmocoma kahamanoa TaxID=1477025 RepID=UPI000E6D9D00|nr:PDF receptor-like [Hyposmocoma kahamanoa]